MARYRIAEAESKLSNRSRQAACRHSPDKKNPASAGLFPLADIQFKSGYSGATTPIIRGPKRTAMPSPESG